MHMGGILNLEKNSLDTLSQGKLGMNAIFKKKIVFI